MLLAVLALTEPLTLQQSKSSRRRLAKSQAGSLRHEKNNAGKHFHIIADCLVSSHGRVGCDTDPDSLDQSFSPPTNRVGGDGVFAKVTQEKSQLDLAKTVVPAAIANRSHVAGPVFVGSNRLPRGSHHEIAWRIDDASLHPAGRQLFHVRSAKRPYRF